MTDSLKELHRRHGEARKTLAFYTRAIKRHKTKERCPIDEHVRGQRGKCVAGGGLSRESLERQIGQKLPAVPGWGGYQVFECVVCGEWLLCSYTGDGMTVISEAAGLKLAGLGA